MGSLGQACAPAALLPEGSHRTMQQTEPVPKECEALGTRCVHLGSLTGKARFGFQLPVPA